MSPPTPQKSLSPALTAPKLGKRAKVACKSCRQRRVKCDVVDVQPCWHCRSHGTRCELTESRREKYTRRKPTATKATEIAPGNPKSIVSHLDARDVPTPQTASEDTFPPVPHVQPHGPQTTSPPSRNGRETHRQSEGPEMLYTRLAESGHSENFRASLSENVRSYYMGDSFSLAFIMRSLSGTSSLQPGRKLHYPIPNTVAEHTADSAESPRDSDPATLAYLNMHGAFTLPPQDARDQLIYVFFECVHPAFPVFDRQAFCELYQQNRTSLLILQTIFFLSSIICGEDTLKRAGFTDRYNARRAFYLRAKALYDMDFEKNKQNLVVGLFLLGFWWESPEDQKDTWHWLGAAISLAQSLGMHRSTANSGMLPRQQSMWKRIWWSIYVRDRHAAAALGRPCRINDEDCDVEMLVADDFFFDQQCDNRLVCVQRRYHQLYAIEMVKLAVILGKVLNHKFAPCRIRSSNVSIDNLRQELEQWEMNLPTEMRSAHLHETLDAPFWSCMAYACFYFCQILLFRPNSSEPDSDQAASFQIKARFAADSITRLVEDLLAAGTLSLGQLHLVPTIFAALSIHTLVIRGGDSLQKNLAENRARQCILGMSELAKGWPVAGWILRLFINLMKRLVGQSVAYGTNLDPRREKHFHVNNHVGQYADTNDPETNSGTCFTTDGRSIHDQTENEFSLLQSDHFMADIMWTDANDLDFDLMLNRAQSNSLFPLSLG